uniref:Transmembrane 9 superfamily member n=1 Tax=Steinernema glaseri TaxID=37863 RepID=A0A1I7Y9L6_9BILA
MASIYPAVNGSSQEARPASPESIHTWRACPIPTYHAVSIVTSIILYSIIYLVYAQYHFALFTVMTGLIAVVICSLYISGLFCVLYMMFRTYSWSDVYPPVPSKRPVKTSIMEVKV